MNLSLTPLLNEIENGLRWQKWCHRLAAPSSRLSAPTIELCTYHHVEKYHTSLESVAQMFSHCRIEDSAQCLVGCTMHNPAQVRALSSALMVGQYIQRVCFTAVQSCQMMASSLLLLWCHNSQSILVRTHAHLLLYYLLFLSNQRYGTDLATYALSGCIMGRVTNDMTFKSFYSFSVTNSSSPNNCVYMVLNNIWLHLECFEMSKLLPIVFGFHLVDHLRKRLSLSFLDLFWGVESFPSAGKSNDFRSSLAVFVIH